jgi:type IV secretion system protein VirB11
MSKHNEHTGIKRSISVDHHLAFAKAWLDDPEITEICVNRPGEVFCERQSVWERHEAPEATYDHLVALATAVARFTDNEISDSRPIMSAVMPEGERVQFVIPPACEHGTVSVTIRKPSFTTRTLADYEEQGFFKHIRPISSDLTPQEAELQKLKAEGNFIEFLRRAVQLEKVIVVAGETGSGKTTFMKALMQEIPPSQRIITIEDVPELFLPQHPNHVHLFYPSEAKEEDNAIVTAASLLKSCLRMKPTRILLAELRGAETFDFINVASSGHGGSITSCHAGSCELAFERLALMVLQNRQGRTLPYQVIRQLLYLVVDVVVHVHNDVTGGTGRHITELWYEPMRKRNKADV